MKGRQKILNTVHGKEERAQEKLLFGNSGGLKSGQKPTCVYFNSEEQKSLHCTKYWIVSRQDGKKYKGMQGAGIAPVKDRAQYRSRGYKNCNKIITRLQWTDCHLTQNVLTPKRMADLLAKSLEETVWPSTKTNVW